MDRVSAVPADRPVPCGTRLQDLTQRVDESSTQIRQALHSADLYALATMRLERAAAELELRDLYGPWAREHGRWNAWLWDDIDRATEAAAELAMRNGDSRLVDRLLMGHPRLQGLVNGPQSSRWQ